MAFHLVTEERGPLWDPALERDDQRGWDAHAGFMDALADNGFVVLGGPVGDGLLVFLVVDAPDEDAIRARLDADPWMDDILSIARIDPWEIRLRGPGARVPRFAVTRRRGPAWDRARGLEEQDDWAGHARFMDALAEEGAIVLGGPLGDGETTLLAFDAESEEAIRERLDADPWVATGLLALVSVEPWQIRLRAPDFG